MLETKLLSENIKYETVLCDFCGSEDYEVWDYARSNTLVKCNKCELVFTNPRIAKSSVKDEVIYSKSYFQQKSRMTDKLKAARKISYRLEIEIIENLSTGGRILDVGCGMGFFLDCFSDRWEKNGCDVSSYALKEAENKGVRIYKGELEHLDFENDFFDVVYFRASLHHTYSPKLCLDKAMKILKPGGVVAICMSNNIDGLVGKIMKAHIRSYEQAHNYLFSTKILETYLVHAGFNIIKIYYPYFSTGYESIRDIPDLVVAYMKYLNLKWTSKLNISSNYDFASPAFYRNYVNIYARKEL